QLELSDHWIPKIRVGRLLRAFEQLLAIDDLHDAITAGAVAEVDAIELRHRDRSVQLGRYRHHRRAGLLSGQTEVANENGLRRIAQVVDLRHARRAPCGIAAHDIRDAGVTFPPALMRVLQPTDDRDNLAGL